MSHVTAIVCSHEIRSMCDMTCIAVQTSIYTHTHTHMQTAIHNRMALQRMNHVTAIVCSRAIRSMCDIIRIAMHTAIHNGYRVA